MDLTTAEREAVERGDFVKFVIPESHVGCIVVREDLLDSLRLRTDYSPCAADDLSRLTAEVLDDEDPESVSLSMDPQFMEIIQRSRARGEREGGVAADEVERKFGHRPNAGDG